MTTRFADFAATLPNDPMELAKGLMGKDVVIDGPEGAHAMVYADYVASGRPLAQVEDFVRDRVLPYYANSHTEDSCCGSVITCLREDARAQIATSCNATDDHAVIFAGSGATAGINKLIHLFRIRHRWFETPVTVLTGPYEHHSNILPWREAGARVIEVPEAAEGGVDLAALDRLIAGARGRLVGAFSAMSNVSGLLSDVTEITRRIKRAGGLMVWDYAGGAPYLPVNMTPAPDAAIDAVVVSPHKFIGGPAASGVVILRRDAVRAERPSVPGGGTVRFVSGAGQDYHRSLELREEGGTPNVLGDIRAGLVFAVKDAIGADWIAQRNAALWRKLAETVDQIDRIVPMGRTDLNRVPVLSFRVRHGDGFHNYKFATTVLSDYFGVQARGGCACAGPYVFRLAGMDAAVTNEVRQEIERDDFSRKPGFIRLNLSYLMTDAEVETVLEALRALPEALDRAEPHYARESAAGSFQRVMAAE